MGLRVVWFKLVVSAVVIGLVVETGACGLGRDPAAPVVSAPPVVHDHRDHGIDVVWVGHATALVRIADRWILTDPNFSDRVGLVYERYVAPGLAIDELPAIDAVLISHAHLDHLDAPSLSALEAGLVVAPPDTLEYVPRRSALGERVALAPWQSVQRRGMTITAVPASHGKGRYYIDALWQRRSTAGFVIEYAGRTVYFAGDTGHQPATSREIGRRFDVDVALVPVGPADRPAWVHHLRKSVHAGPDEALRIFEEVGADHMVPIHYGTFFKRTAGEHAAIRGAIAQHRLGGRVRMLPIGGHARFP